MIKLRIKDPEEILHESKNLYNFTEIDGKGAKIHNLNLETFIEEVRDLELPIIPRIIQLPNNELFCFEPSSFDSNVACIIDCFAEKKIKWINLFDNTSLAILGASCLKNSIFIWTWDWSSISLWKHDLNKGKNVALASFPIHCNAFCQNVCLEGKILISYFLSDIYVYDLEINSYSIVKVSENKTRHLLVSGKTNAYYIQIFGSIYESALRIFIFEIKSEIQDQELALIHHGQAIIIL